MAIKNFLIKNKKLEEISDYLINLPRNTKKSLVFVIDIFSCFLSVIIAFYLRKGFFLPLKESNFIAIFISLILALPIFSFSGMYGFIFRYSGWSSMYLITRSILIYGAFYSFLITLVGIPEIPRTIGLIQPILLLMLLFFTRTLARYWFGILYVRDLSGNNKSKAIIYGAGAAGNQLASALVRMPEINLIGFLDDNKSQQGRSLNGYPVYSPGKLENLILSKGITDILLAIPSANRKKRDKLINKLRKYKVAVRTIPSLSDLAKGKVKTSTLIDLDIYDLLGRDRVDPRPELMEKNISSKVVLITGAGGSIGSELCRQIFRLKPEKIILVELNEYALYLINSELQKCNGIASIKEKIEIIPIIASVQDKNRISEIFKEYKPSCIFHAAAYKHVPLVEQNIIEGVKNNVFGTLNTALVAIDQNIEHFVFISSDKAVYPTNVMGATKRLSEICLQSLFNRSDINFQTKFSMVRFGNVLASSGSVIPKFKSQIIEGGPITLTHQEITRYFMTIKEAAELVIQASSLAEGGDVFLLDMGQPIKIKDLAYRMVELSGLKVKDKSNPDGDIEIKVTGLRPGEKLYEELLLGDNPFPTIHPKIFRAQDPFLNWDILDKKLNNLEISILQNNSYEVLAALRDLVKGYRPSKKTLNSFNKNK